MNLIVIIGGGHATFSRRPRGSRAGRARAPGLRAVRAVPPAAAVQGLSQERRRGPPAAQGRRLVPDAGIRATWATPQPLEVDRAARTSRCVPARCLRLRIPRARHRHACAPPAGLCPTDSTTSRCCARSKRRTACARTQLRGGAGRHRARRRLHRPRSGGHRPGARQDGARARACACSGRAVSAELSAHVLATHRAAGINVVPNAKVDGFAIDGTRLAELNFNDTRQAIDLLLLEHRRRARDRARPGHELLVPPTASWSTRAHAHQRLAGARHRRLHALPGSPRRPALRLESVQNANDQARTATATLTGAPNPHDVLPWFWSEQGSLRLQMAGLMPAEGAPGLTSVRRPGPRREPERVLALPLREWAAAVRRVGQCAGRPHDEPQAARSRPQPRAGGGGRCGGAAEESLAINNIAGCARRTGSAARFALNRRRPAQQQRLARAVARLQPLAERSAS